MNQSLASALELFLSDDKLCQEFGSSINSPEEMAYAYSESAFRISRHEEGKEALLALLGDLDHERLAATIEMLLNVSSSKLRAACEEGIATECPRLRMASFSWLESESLRSTLDRMELGLSDNDPLVRRTVMRFSLRTIKKLVLNVEKKIALGANDPGIDVREILKDEIADLDVEDWKHIKNWLQGDGSAKQPHR